MKSPNPLTRLYFSGPLGAYTECVLPREQSHHVAHVLRLQTGDAVTMFDGSGAEYPAVITRITKSGVTLETAARRDVDRESRLSLLLAQGISSGERMDFTVQKAVELGVAAIQPLTTARSIVRLDAERSHRRLLHWRSIASAACEQCGRNRVPDVLPVSTLAAWLAVFAGGDATRLIFLPTAATHLRDLPSPSGPVTFLIGPEGGFDGAEERAAADAGFLPVLLGPRVLRTETAAVAALSAMQALWGDF